MVPLAQQMQTAGRGWRGRSTDPWGDRNPIRSEIFGPDRFEQHAVSLADSQTVVRAARNVVSIMERLNDDDAALVRAYEAIVDDVQNQRTITPAA